MSITGTVTIDAAYAGTITAAFPSTVSPNYVAVNEAGDLWVDDDGAFILWA